MKKLSILSIFFFAFLFSTNAQQYLKQPVLQARPVSKKTTFGDVQRAFESYWKNKNPSETEGKNAEEGGWQQFKRWEWFAKQRTFPSGEFPNSEILFNEFNKYKQENKISKNLQTNSANWTFIGPHVVPSGSGGSGRINCLTFDPANSNILWIGAACGGVWKSVNGGTSWSSNTDLLPSLSISDIVIDPTNSQNMYLATGDKYGIYYQYETWGHYSAGVLKSTNGGVTWNATGMNYNLANNILIQRLILDSNSPLKLFAATNSGIFKTTNGGTTWTNIRAGKFYDIEFHPTNHNIIYAGDSVGVIRSIDGGTTWNYVSTVVSTGRTSISVTPSNPNAVYVWAEPGSFYYSNNSGVSFTARTNPGSNCTPYGYYDMVLEVSPINENILFAGGMEIAKTTDGGNTWTKVSSWNSYPNSDYVHADNHAQLFAPGSSTTIFSMNDGGIFKSTDQGTTWSDLSGGIDIKQYYRLSSSFLTPTLIYAGAQDNGTDRVTGLNAATQVYGADGETCLVDYTNDNTVFVSSQSGNFLKSTDGGNTFNGAGATGCDWTSPLVMDPLNNNVMYMGSTDVLKSTDNGNTWNNVSNGVFDGSCLYSLEVAHSNTNYIYAATFGHLYRSVNGGTSWTNITGTLPVNFAALTGVAINGSNPDAAWVTFSGFSAGNKVFYTNNGGTTWTNISGTLPNIPVNCVEYQNGSNDIVYIGTDFGVFYTDATQNNWVSYNTGLPNVIIDELEVYFPTSKLRAATYGRGLWESDLQISVLSNVDAATSTMMYPPVSTCDSVIAPVVSIRNAGLNTLTSVDLNYHIDAQSNQVYNWTGSLASLATTNITLPSYTLVSGTHTLVAYTSNPNVSADQNHQNDTIKRTFTILGAPFPLINSVAEGFVAASFPPVSWSIENSSNLWSRSTTVGGYSLSTQSAKADFYSISSGTDVLITADINFQNLAPPIKVYFDHAYALYDSTYHDSLLVDLYSDCSMKGEIIYANGRSALATAPATTATFVPTASQWRTDTLHLDSLAGHAPMRLRFIAKSGFGNELYLDNINLSNTVTGVSSIGQESSVVMFPNPTSGILNVWMSKFENVQIKIYDVLGECIHQLICRSANQQIDLSSLHEGIYLVKIQGDNFVKTERVVVIK